MAKNRHNYVGMFSYDFPVIFLWFSYDPEREIEGEGVEKNTCLYNLSVFCWWSVGGFRFGTAPGSSKDHFQQDSRRFVWLGFCPFLVHPGSMNLGFSFFFKLNVELFHLGIINLGIFSFQLSNIQRSNLQFQKLNVFIFAIFRFFKVSSLENSKLQHFKKFGT